MNALRMHSRRFGVLAIARRHPRLFSRLLCLATPSRHLAQPTCQLNQMTSLTQKTSETPCPTQKQ
jgi:hypothetical protein